MADPKDAIFNQEKIRATLCRAGNPPPNDSRMKTKFTDQSRRLRLLPSGLSDVGKPMKTILIVRATGAGKSTLINAFANYLLGEKFTDDVRFRIVDEPLESNQSHGQTESLKRVTAYVLHRQRSFPEELSYSFTIIDTPGFGDTSGIEVDKAITGQLESHFYTEDHGGIATQSNIFDSILALFGKDLKDNIFMFMTFAGGQKPPVIAALKEAELPYTQAFIFNKSALFALHAADEYSDDRESFDVMFWKMGATSYRKFMTELGKTELKSLVLTKLRALELGWLQGG